MQHLRKSLGLERRLSPKEKWRGQGQFGSLPRGLGGNGGGGERSGGGGGDKDRYAMMKSQSAGNVLSGSTALDEALRSSLSANQLVDSPGAKQPDSKLNNRRLLGALARQSRCILALPLVLSLVFVTLASRTSLSPFHAAGFGGSGHRAWGIHSNLKAAAYEAKRLASSGDISVSSHGVPMVTLTGITTSTEGHWDSGAGEVSGSGQKEATRGGGTVRGGGGGVGYSDTAPAPGPDSDNPCGALYDPDQFAEGPGRFPKMWFRVIPGRYLLMYCVRGQISNRVLCMRQHLILAALLNRTLIIPNRVTEQFERPYDMRLVWDLERARQCLGPDALITTEEYEDQFQRKVSIDRLHCWHGPARSCPNDPRRRDLDCPAMVHPGHAINTIEKYPNRTWSKPLFVDPKSHLQSHFLTDQEGGLLAYGSCMDYEVPADEIVAEFKQFNESILAVGDLVDRSVAFPGVAGLHLERIFERSPECAQRPLHAPPDGLFRKAQEIAVDLFGEEGSRNFLAVHWRRGDFAYFCFQAKSSRRCFYPPDQAANCTLRTAAKYGLKHVFLASNGAPHEIRAYEQYIRDHSGGQVVVKRFPPNVHLEPQWLESENATAQRVLIEAMLDKLVCAHSKVFMGSWESTFTQDIVSFRYGTGALNCNDTLLCWGEDEWPTDVDMPEDFKREKKEWFEKLDKKQREAEQKAELERLQEKDRQAAAGKQ